MSEPAQQGDPSFNQLHQNPEEKSQIPNDQTHSRTSSEAPWSVFSKKETVLIVLLGSLAAFLSPLTANIYYPAINDLSHDLHVSYSLINLTITVYLIFMGLAPTVVGSISDVAGRRPAYLICFTIYIASNIGLSLQNSYAALMVLRCLQSSGSSGTVALGSAMVADIATSSQRGSYIGYASVGALVGPAVGPIIGGLLNQFLGWRAIFWFLVMLSAIISLIFVIVLPETCRAVVGNGSIPPQHWNMSLLTYLKQREQRNKGEVPAPLLPLARKPINLFGTLDIIFSKISGCVLLYAGLLFGGFYTVAASIPADFLTVYHFNPVQIGLCYIPFGFGSMTAAIVTGKLLDLNFARHTRLLGIPITKNRQSSIRAYPIELARLEVASPLIISSCLLMPAYSWVIHARSNLAGPLILLYPLGFSMTGAFMALSTLVTDLNIERPGTATAAGNWVRCWIGAGSVAIIAPLLEKIGTGWVGVLVVGIWVAFSPLLWVVVKGGPGWREDKVIRDEERDVGVGKDKGRDVEAAGRMLSRSENEEVGKS
ncbi:MFS general substrate transporter [Stipitochalara longipes BDJ]|nr:MFS general substrate transporter [Stipitochalara longipes BDJ]